MSRTPARLAAAAGAALALAVSGVAAALPAQAATCYAASCNGKSPTAAGCGSISTLRRADFGDGLKHVELRYSSSSSCKAFWARGTYDDVYWSASYLVFSVERRYDYNGWTSYYSGDVDEGESGFTLMFGRARGFSYRACMTEKIIDGTFVATKCTSWVAG